MPLHTDYRPRDFDEFIANDAMLKSLKSVLSRKDRQHTYLITGPSGCGKTSLAHIIRRELDVADSEFYLYNASNTRGIDTVREVLSTMSLAPMIGNNKAYFFEECHMLTSEAQESLLKDTEKPPDHVYFIFATTDPQKLKDTFKRRAFHAQVDKLVRSEMMRLLKEVVESELADRLDHGDRQTSEHIRSFPEELYEHIIESADGSPGVALKMLDSVLLMENYDDAKYAITKHAGEEVQIIDIARALVDERIDEKARWEKIRKILSETATDPENTRRMILKYLEKVFLNGKSPVRMSEMISIFGENVFYSGKAGLAVMCFLASNVK